LDPETAVEHGDLPSSFVSITDCSATIRTFIEFPISCCGALPLWPYPQPKRESDLGQNELSIARRNHHANCVNVRFGSKADIAAPPTNVRFTPKSGH
jgi:hypothetical protein